MTLKSPFFIGSNLCPAIRIGDATISLEQTERCDRRGAPYWKWEILIDSGETYCDSDLSGWQDMQGMFATILDFLCAAGESYHYRVFVKKSAQIDDDENEGGFPAPIPEWAYMHSDEIACMRCEIEETAGLIED